MTMIERNRFAERAPFLQIGDAMEKIASYLRAKARAHRNRKALKTLSDMEDWQLKDIGVSRSEVEEALFTRK